LGVLVEDYYVFAVNTGTASLLKTLIVIIKELLSEDFIF